MTIIRCPFTGKELVQRSHAEYYTIDGDRTYALSVLAAYGNPKAPVCIHYAAFIVADSPADALMRAEQSNAPCEGVQVTFNILGQDKSTVQVLAERK